MSVPCRRWTLPLRGGAILLALATLAAACGGSAGADGGDSRVGGSGPSGEILVSAAASLADAFGDIETAFETAHPDADVILNLGGSSTLREQILEGAPADVFAAANEATMAQVVDAGSASGDPAIFARNSLQIAVPPGNPAGVRGLEDFADPALFLGLCAEAVPCGDFARQVLANAGVNPSIDTNEPDVRALLTKIAAGELDAGVTYVTDVASAGADVDGVEIPADLNVTAAYPIVVLADAPNPTGAAAFVDFVRSEQGQEILRARGFSSADSSPDSST